MLAYTHKLNPAYSSNRAALDRIIILCEYCFSSFFVGVSEMYALLEKQVLNQNHKAFQVEALYILT